MNLSRTPSDLTKFPRSNGMESSTLSTSIHDGHRGVHVEEDFPTLSPVDRQLWATHGLDQIRHVLAQKQQAIEAKKQEMRQLVGHSYRKLIDSAESIMEMEKVARTALDNLTKAQSSFVSIEECAEKIDYTLKRVESTSSTSTTSTSSYSQTSTGLSSSSLGQSQVITSSHRELSSGLPPCLSLRQRREMASLQFVEALSLLSYQCQDIITYINTKRFLLAAQTWLAACATYVRLVSRSSTLVDLANQVVKQTNQSNKSDETQTEGYCMSKQSEYYTSCLKEAECLDLDEQMCLTHAIRLVELLALLPLNIETAAVNDVNKRPQSPAWHSDALSACVLLSLPRHLSKALSSPSSSSASIPTSIPSTLTSSSSTYSLPSALPLALPIAPSSSPLNTSLVSISPTNPTSTSSSLLPPLPFSSLVAFFLTSRSNTINDICDAALAAVSSAKSSLLSSSSSSSSTSTPETDIAANTPLPHATRVGITKTVTTALAAVTRCFCSTVIHGSALFQGQNLASSSSSSSSSSRSHSFTSSNTNDSLPVDVLSRVKHILNHPSGPTSSSPSSPSPSPSSCMTDLLLTTALMITINTQTLCSSVPTITTNSKMISDITTIDTQTPSTFPLVGLVYLANRSTSSSSSSSSPALASLLSSSSKPLRGDDRTSEEELSIITSAIDKRILSLSTSPSLSSSSPHPVTSSSTFSSLVYDLLRPPSTAVPHATSSWLATLTSSLEPRIDSLMKSIDTVHDLALVRDTVIASMQVDPHSRRDDDDEDGVGVDDKYSDMTHNGSQSPYDIMPHKDVPVPLAALSLRLVSDRTDWMTASSLFVSRVLNPFDIFILPPYLRHASSLVDRAAQALQRRSIALIAVALDCLPDRSGSSGKNVGDIVALKGERGRGEVEEEEQGDKEETMDDSDVDPLGYLSEEEEEHEYKHETNPLGSKTTGKDVSSSTKTNQLTQNMKNKLSRGKRVLNRLPHFRFSSTTQGGKGAFVRAARLSPSEVTREVSNLLANTQGDHGMTSEGGAGERRLASGGMMLSTVALERAAKEALAFGVGATELLGDESLAKEREYISTTTRGKKAAAKANKVMNQRRLMAIKALATVRYGIEGWYSPIIDYVVSEIESLLSSFADDCTALLNLAHLPSTSSSTSSSSSISSPSSHSTTKSPTLRPLVCRLEALLSSTSLSLRTTADRALTESWSGFALFVAQVVGVLEASVLESLARTEIDSIALGSTSPLSLRMSPDIPSQVSPTIDIHPSPSSSHTMNHSMSSLNPSPALGRLLILTRIAHHLIYSPNSPVVRVLLSLSTPHHISAVGLPSLAHLISQPPPSVAALITHLTNTHSTPASPHTPSSTTSAIASLYYLPFSPLIPSPGTSTFSCSTHPVNSPPSQVNTFPPLAAIYSRLLALSSPLSTPPRASSTPFTSSSLPLSSLSTSTSSLIVARSLRTMFECSVVLWSRYHTQIYSHTLSASLKTWIAAHSSASHVLSNSSSPSTPSSPSSSLLSSLGVTTSHRVSPYMVTLIHSLSDELSQSYGISPPQQVINTFLSLLCHAFLSVLERILPSSMSSTSLLPSPMNTLHTLAPISLVSLAVDLIVLFAILRVSSHTSSSSPPHFLSSPSSASLSTVITLSVSSATSTTSPSDSTTTSTSPSNNLSDTTTAITHSSLSRAKGLLVPVINCLSSSSLSSSSSPTLHRQLLDLAFVNLTRLALSSPLLAKLLSSTECALKDMCREMAGVDAATWSSLDHSLSSLISSLPTAAEDLKAVHRAMPTYPVSDPMPLANVALYPSLVREKAALFEEPSEDSKSATASDTTTIDSDERGVLGKDKRISTSGSAGSQQSAITNGRNPSGPSQQHHSQQQQQHGSRLTSSLSAITSTSSAAQALTANLLSSTAGQRATALFSSAASSLGFAGLTGTAQKPRSDATTTQQPPSTQPRLSSGTVPSSLTSSSTSSSASHTGRTSQSNPSIPTTSGDPVFNDITKTQRAPTLPNASHDATRPKPTQGPRTVDGKQSNQQQQQQTASNIFSSWLY